ncbi:MAG: hypothetical protein ACRC0G_15945 [Fusobacteriaceae bacterium]
MWVCRNCGEEVIADWEYKGSGKARMDKKADCEEVLEIKNETGFMSKYHCLECEAVDFDDVEVIAEWIVEI